MSNLEQLFDNATFESSIEGDDKDYNAVRLTPGSYPYLNGHRVSAIQIIDGPAILEVVSKSGAASQNYEYRELSETEVNWIKALEFDPYNDAHYSDQLLDKFYRLVQ